LKAQREINEKALNTAAECVPESAGVSGDGGGGRGRGMNRHTSADLFGIKNHCKKGEQRRGVIVPGDNSARRWIRGILKPFHT
jgi:hypothetical protein